MRKETGRAAAGVWYNPRMKRGLVEILACPACKGGLDIEATHADGGEVLTGSLRCSGCGTVYAIEDGIPVLAAPAYA